MFARLSRTTNLKHAYPRGRTIISGQTREARGFACTLTVKVIRPFLTQNHRKNNPQNISKQNKTKSTHASQDSTAGTQAAETPTILPASYKTVQLRPRRVPERRGLLQRRLDVVKDHLRLEGRRSLVRGVREAAARRPQVGHPRGPSASSHRTQHRAPAPRSPPLVDALGARTSVYLSRLCPGQGRVRLQR